MEDDDSFTQVLTDLKSCSRKRDPRSTRLAAVTAALVDVIQGDVSAAQVYASTVTTLEGTLQQEQAVDSLSTQVALMELLSVTIAHVAPATIGATIPVTSRVLRGVVASCQAVSAEGTMETQDELGGINAVLRGACRASTEVLRCIPPNSPDKVVRQLLHGTLLTLFQDPRPRVRRAAHNGVCELVVMEQPSCHAAVLKGSTAYLHAHLESVRQDPLKESNNMELLHLLGFLQRSILYMDATKLGSDLMEMIVKLLQDDSSALTESSNFITLSRKDSTVKVLTINAILSTVLAMLADDSLVDSKKAALDDYAKRVLASLLQARPALTFREGIADPELLESGRTIYGQVALASCQRLFDGNQAQMGCKLLPLTINLVLNLSRPLDDAPDGIVAETLMVELTQLFRAQLAPLAQSEPKQHEKCCKDCLLSMEQIFQSAYEKTWSVSLKALAVLLQQMQVSDDLVGKSVKSLLSLRSSGAEDQHSQHAVDGAISSLIQEFGIEDFWPFIEWTGFNSSESGINKDQAWILPLLKSAGNTNGTRRTHFAFFQSEVLALARQCDTLTAKKPTEAALHKSRVLDLWALVPCFCRKPADLESAFPALAQILVRAMGDKRYPELITIICGGLETLVKGVQDRAAEFQELIEGEEAEECRREAEVVGTVSSKLLPSLFKFVDSLHSSEKSSKQNMQIDEDQLDESSDNKIGETFTQVQALTQAIASLARVAPQALLQTLFKKVIQRLLEASQQQQQQDMSDKICSLLSLSQALVISQSLDETSISLLYRSLKPLIRTDEARPRVQKRAYKAMAEICHRYHSFAIEGDRLKELCELLTSSIITSQISARHMRLKCLNNIVDGFDSSNKAHMETISKLVGEVLLCLKDSNAKTREAAYQLLLSMAKIQEDIPGFFRLVAAALGAETTQMRSAAVMAMSRLVFEFAREDLALQSLLPSLLQTVIVLFDDTSREVIKSVVGFVRVCVAAMTPEQLEPLLPELANGLLKYHRGKDRFRAKIKIILKKLVKLYGFDRLMPLVPESDTRLLTHMRKLSERDARRRARNQDRKPQDSVDFDEMIGSDEEDSDDGRTLMTGATGFSQMTGRTGKSMLSRMSKSRSGRTAAESTTMSRKSNGETSIRLKNDVNGEVFDVADLAAKSVRFANDDNNDDESDDGAMEFDGSGKLIVRDDFDEENLEQNSGLSTENDVVMAGSKKWHVSKFETAKLGAEEARKKKQHGKGNASKLGSAYKSKKAGGDVIRKGQKYEPYAYVPLDGKRYTKKNRREAVEQMSTVVRKGAKRQRR